MVKKLLPFFFILFILASCGGRYRALMDMAEAQMTSAPDSSLALLERIGEKDLHTRGLQARYFLLRTMARDKCYMDMAGDTCIRVSYEWYQHHGGKRYHMLASYYAGVVQQAAGNSLEATLAFREAEPLAEALSDYRQLSLIEQHLSAVFAGNYDHVRALEYAEKSLKAAEVSGDSLMADYCRLDIIYQLLTEYRYTEAESIIDELLQKKRISSEFFTCVCGLKARVLLFKKPHDIKGARAIYDSLLTRGADYLRTADYGRLALIEEVDGNSNAADFLLEKEFSFVEDKIDSLEYFNDCYNVYDRRGDWKKSLHYLSKRSDLQDEIVMGLLAQSETHALEVYYRENLSLAELRSRYRSYMVITMGVILFIVIVALIARIRKKNHRLLEDMARIQEFSDDLEQLRANNKATYDIVEKLISDKVHSMQHLSESFFSWDDMEIKRREQKKGMMMKDEIITAFRRQLGELRDEHSFIKALEQSINISEDNLMSRARQVLPNEKELDFSILTLLFSGFSIKSISYLLRMSEASLRMRKTRYKKQFDSLPEQERKPFLEKLRA